MTKPIVRDPIYRKRAFDADIIELCVRWYITYRLSYRDLVEMMAERGVEVAHTTVLRLVTHVRPRVREAMEPILQGRRHLVARGRDVYLDQSQVALSLPRRRQTWKNGRLPAPARPRNRCGPSVLSKGARLDTPTRAAQSNARWARSEPSGAVAPEARAPVLAQREGTE